MSLKFHPSSFGQNRVEMKKSVCQKKSLETPKVSPHYYQSLGHFTLDEMGGKEKKKWHLIPTSDAQMTQIAIRYVAMFYFSLFYFFRIPLSGLVELRNEWRRRFYITSQSAVLPGIDNLPKELLVVIRRSLQNYLGR